jgi:hypothetical protein
MMNCNGVAHQLMDGSQFLLGTGTQTHCGRDKHQTRSQQGDNENQLAPIAIDISYTLESALHHGSFFREYNPA